MIEDPPTPAATRAWSRRPAARARGHVQRAIAELLGGRPVRIVDPSLGARLVLPVDALEPGAIAALRAVADGPPSLIVSRTRAAALGLATDRAVALSLGDAVTESQVVELAAGEGADHLGDVGCTDRIGEAAIELAKLALLLPAALLAPVDADAPIEDLLSVDAGDVLAFRGDLATTLRRVASAPVPLAGAPESEWTVFRDALGQSWSMIRVGRPDPSRPVPVRLHSACLTGDAFGSLRCDCGDQLRMAVSAIAALGGGVVLYLAQEGCGLGLANKMRAYGLQDQGRDTVDANTALGFETDERRYDAAVRMLRGAGITRVALLTNNPSKLDALRTAGLDVVERIPLLAPVRGGNRRYLDAKRLRAGHLFGDLLSARGG